MIEIYRNSTEYVGLSLYRNDGPFDAEGTPTVTLYDDETNQVLSPANMANHDSTGKYSFLIGLRFTQDERRIRAVWHFNIGADEASKTDVIEIVTPYATPDEIKFMYPSLVNKDIDEIKELEKRARFIIDSYTGQHFGLKRKVMTLRYGDTTTFLTEPCVEVESVHINGYFFDPLYTGLTIDNNGWIIRLPELWNHVYYASWRPELMLHRGATYNLTGLFGYRSVPSDVSLAAAMLINDYACREDIYRQKGLTSVRAADWRFEYGDNSYKGTGNVDVDQLLAKYRGFGAAIL